VGGDAGGRQLSSEVLRGRLGEGTRLASAATNWNEVKKKHQKKIVDVYMWRITVVVERRYPLTGGGGGEGVRTAIRNPKNLGKRRKRALRRRESAAAMRT